MHLSDSIIDYFDILSQKKENLYKFPIIEGCGKTDDYQMDIHRVEDNKITYKFKYKTRAVDKIKGILNALTDVNRPANYSVINGKIYIPIVRDGFKRASIDYIWVSINIENDSLKISLESERSQFIFYK